MKHAAVSPRTLQIHIYRKIAESTFPAQLRISGAGWR